MFGFRLLPYMCEADSLFFLLRAARSVFPVSREDGSVFPSLSMGSGLRARIFHLDILVLFRGFLQALRIS